MGKREEQIILETDRLILRKFTTEDAPFILRLLNDPSWLRFIGDRHVHTLEDAEQYLINGALRSYRVNGFGPGLMMLKETGEPVGMCGLFKRDFLEDADLGFALLPEFTGQGYGEEVARATVWYAREKLGISRLSAFTAKDNEASLRLLKKIGFNLSGVVVLDGEELYLLTVP